MIKTYISSLLVVLVGAQTIRAQESLDDVFAQLDAAQSSEQAAAPAATAAEVQTAEPAAVEVAVVEEEASSGKFALGMEYYQAGELVKAEAAFEAALVEDPYDRKAMHYLKLTARRIQATAGVLRSTTRAQRIAEVSDKWNPDLRTYDVDLNEDKEDELSPEELAIQAMTARLEGIVIPSLDFRDANIKDVVLFLTETCRRQDPSKQGVNILLLGMEDSMSADQNNITISIRDMNVLEALQYIVEMASLKFEVKPKAVAVMPVNYVPPEDLKLVSFTVIPEVGMELESATGDGGGGADDLFGDASASESTGPADVKGFFSIVDWPEGAHATYEPAFHKLFVKNTKKNIASVENILNELEDEAIKKRAQQVEIEAKFVEYSEGALEELGFDWTVYGSGKVGDWYMRNDRDYYQQGVGANEYDLDATPDGGELYTDPTTGYKVITEPRTGTSTVDSGRAGQSLFGNFVRNNVDAFETLQSGILSSMGGSPSAMFFSTDEVGLRITAMEQEGTADVLSAPRITTKSGNEAIIRVVEVHRYPQDYDVETGQRTAPVVKPQDWEDYDLGVVLKVTPVVDAENNTIDLDLAPEITKFKGFDDYIVGYNSYETGGNNTTPPDNLLGDGSALLARMPYFETRTVQTQVTIYDGSTVVMGGLVDERTETFRDSVPFLGDIPYIGRLFRTEGSRSSKKNLVIYVKATQVDDKGMTRDQRERAREMAAN